MQLESRDGAIWGTAVDANAQDPRMWSVPGRMLRVGITNIISKVLIVLHQPQSELSESEIKI